MKLKVRIFGPKVHDVGYRYFLMSNAIDIGLKGFHGRNRMGENGPEVTALVEGNEETIADFKKLVESQKPEHAQVSSVVFEEYEGDIMRTTEYAFVCTTIQLNKAIPLLLDIRDNLKEMKGDMKAVRKNTDIIPQIGEDIKAVKANTSESTEEIRGMREDIQPGYARQMQADVRAIKERLGMP
jgi:acylphosphatase